MSTILFVCTGNIFRSMIAEHAFRARQSAGLPFTAASAGIEANPQPMYPPVQNLLIERGIDPSAHQQRKLTAELLNTAHLTIAMGHDHQAFIRDHFQKDVPLFNHVCFDTEDPIPDIWEAVPNYKNDEAARKKYALYVADYIWEAMPVLFQNLG